jgi:hypothetical protein
LTGSFKGITDCFSTSLAIAFRISAQLQETVRGLLLGVVKEKQQKDIQVNH